MDAQREEDEFRRMAINDRVERAKGLIAQYREHISFYRSQLDDYYYLLGRIGERLGDPEPKGPS